MKTIDMRQCTDEFAKNISAYGKVRHITFKNENYSITINSINFFKKNFDNIYIETGFIVPELKNGDIVSIVPSYEKINLSSNKMIEEEIVEEGIYKLRCINKKFGSTTKLEYIFKEVESNYALKFQNPSTKQIHERRCMIKPFARLGKVYDNHGYEIQIPTDEETKLFYTGKRFLIGMESNEPIAYRIIQIDPIANQGDLIISVERDQLNENDNHKLMVADYQEENIPLLGSSKILFHGEPSLKMDGAPKSFTAIFKDRFGKEITEINPCWELDFSHNPELSGRVYIIKESGNEITIQSKSNDKLFDKSFILKASGESDEYGYFESSIEIKLDGLW